jgi:hypothetical protein
MNKIDTITIIGGGTAAWMSAAFLSNKNPNMSITIIDKEIGNPVSVGEATILNFGPFMDECGFDPIEWFVSLDATYKSGILFPDWVENGKDVWHPFFMNPILENGETMHDAWCKNKKYDFVEYALPMYFNSIENKIDKNEIGAYAFHIDCGKLVEFIKNKLQYKVNFIQSEVIQVEKIDNKINKVFLKNFEVIESDLFVDCTGGKSLLKEQDRNYLDGRLFCDTAIASRIPYNNRKEEMKPYVISESVDHGWIWKIPVRTRIGSGLVFNRSITEIDVAKKYFLEHWNHRVSEDELKVLDWIPYYSNNIWEENIVSIGLSAGFIEPLESTGVALIIEGLVKLQNKISDKTWTFSDVLIYNEEMKSSFEDCIDFVSMHYSKSYKDTPFWNFVRQTYKPSDRIIQVENLLSKQILYTRNKKDHHVFSGANWSTWMIQLGYEANTKSPITKNISKFNMLNYHNRVEKYRSSWSIDHESEISRIELFYGLKK